MGELVDSLVPGGKRGSGWVGERERVGGALSRCGTWTSDRQHGAETSVSPSQAGKLMRLAVFVYPYLLDV